MLADRPKFSVRTAFDTETGKYTLQYENRSAGALLFSLYTVEDNVQNDLNAEYINPRETVFAKVPADSADAVLLTLQVMTLLDADGGGYMEGEVLFSEPVTLHAE